MRKLEVVAGILIILIAILVMNTCSSEPATTAAPSVNELSDV
ncbi:hypothetical protein [Aliidiomarina sp.]|nr:hypothetical protein [Aliidiomarina sp.]